MNKPLKIRLHVLSPIHIGCDDVYEPTSFVIDENKKKLIEFDPMDFINALNDKQRAEFSRVCSGDNLLSIMKFIKNNSMKIKGREVDIASELIAHYKKVLGMSSFDKNTVINQFTMNKTAYNPQTNLPYIPGTSLKGSMRTAYLSALSVVTHTKDFWKSCGLISGQDLENSQFTYNQIGKKQVAKKLEQKLLNGKFDTDPFRMVKVSDLLPVGEVKTKIVYAVNRKKVKSDRATLAEKGGVYQIFETIQPGSVFEGTININMPEKTAGISLPITADSLKSSLNKFYIPLLETEIKALKGMDISVPIINDINAKFKGQINKTVFVVSIGRHSGAEAVTIEGNRYIKIMQGRDKGGRKRYEFKDHTTTLWLASDSPRPQNNNGLLPFGWAAIEIIGEV
ncbi:MAG: type III-A CRISPR-associated RAMP protein Csm5 [Thermodesulfovibrionales bacterium]